MRYSHHRNSAFLLIIILALIATAFWNALTTTGLADTKNSWSRSGPVVGTVNSLAVAASNPSILYAGISSNSGGFGTTSTSGIYKSTDGGASWSRAGLVGKTIYSLAVDPTNPNTVYAGTRSNGLYKSTDGGASWSGPFINSSADVYALAIDPKHPSVLYASATNLGLVKSTDGGATWNTANNGIHALIHEIAIDPGNTNTVYAVGGYISSTAIYKSTDAGNSWSVSSTGIPDSTDDTVSIAFSQSNTSIIYVAKGSDVYKSTDAGASWTKTSGGLPGSSITKLTVDPFNPSVVFAATNSKGIFKTADGGVTWTSTGLNSISVNTLNFQGANSSSLYAGTRGSGVLKTIDGGLSWSQSSNTPYGDARELLIDPSNLAVIYANNSDTLSRSTDRGVNWSSTNLVNHIAVVPGIPTHKLIIDLTNSATLYLGVDFVGVFKTTDSGATWNQVYLQNTNIEALAIDPHNPKTIYLATYPANLLKSTDAGATWVNISSPGDVAVLAVDPGNSSVVYAGTNFGVSKSTNGGASWTLTSLRNSSSSNPYIITLLIDPTNTSVLYAATYNGGAFKSVDGGASWTPVFTDVAGHVLSFTTDPSTPNTVFAGTEQGVYQSTNGGQTSSALATGWPSPAQPAMSLAFDSVGKYLYAGTSDGVYVYQVSATPPNGTVISSVSGSSVFNGKATLTATLTSGGSPLSGKTVSFTLNSNTVGTATTDSNGVATLSGVNISGINTGTYPTAIGATFAGDANYTSSSNAGLLTISKATPVITWNNPANINSATPLSGAQLNATASVPGTFTYTPSAGTTLSAGTHQLSVTFAPTDSANYNSATKSVQLTVDPVYSVTGQVKDSSNNPLSGVLVTFDMNFQGTLSTKTALTDANGNYSSGDLGVQNNVRVTPSKSGYTFTPSAIAFVSTGSLSGSATANFTATLSPTSTVQFSQSNYSVGEASGNISITVTRTGDTSGAATVNYATSDTAGLTACNQAGTGIASSRCDYATTVGTLQFAAGDTSKTIFIPIVNDSYAEGNESFNIRLSNPSGATLGSISTATITIIDDDQTTGSNPIVDPAFFIRQQYIDFLGREPDPPGLTGWLDVLNNCGTKYPTPCDRIEVSAGFFRSPEFQDRGYFVFRFYPVALGRNPAYAEFMPDLAKVSGFLTDAQLDANKLAFVKEFMARPEFQGRYDLVNDAGFVDALLQTAGLPNHPNRTTWINALASQTMTRAQVLRALAESAEVYNKFYNQSFVVMQYFGYLRRDPDILYLQWIDTMNMNGGDYRTMINGFLNSSEYFLRFGP